MLKSTLQLLRHGQLALAALDLIVSRACFQFGGQEPGSNAQIKSFAKSKGATFPLMDKVEVNGANGKAVQ